MLKRISLHTIVLLTGLLAVLQFNSGCGGEAAVPSYVKLDSIYLDSTNYDSTGSVAHKITAAWVYVDDNLQGVYQLPCIIPIVDSGNVTFTIFGGVQENGSSAQYSRYPFYAPMEIAGTLIAGDTLVLQPHIRYNPGLKINWMEDFEDDFVPKLVFSSGSGNFSYATGPEAFEGDYGSFYMQEGDSMLVVQTEVITVPKGKVGYFIELNYKSDTDMLLSLLVGTDEVPLIGVAARNYWNKIYVNITNQVDIMPGNDFRIVFRMLEDKNLNDQEIYIDNLKVVYQ